MEEKADEYRITGVNKNGREFSRKLRADAVIGFALIFHPPEAVAADWTPERRRKFNTDSWKAMEKIEPRIFRKQNVKMIACHRDEGVEHWHVIGDAIDENGRYCGNLIDAALCVKINEQYPAMMRELGWDIEDAELTDFARMGKDENGEYVDPEYRAEVQARKRGGRSVSEYAEAQAKEQIAEAARMYGDAAKALQEAQKALQEAEKASQEAQEDREATKAMLGQTRRLIGSGEAHKAELARRQLPGQAQSDIAKRLGLT